MRKFLITTALAGTLALGGCATTGGTPTTGGVDPAVITAVQQFTQNLQVGCGYLPLYQTVQDVILAGAYPPGIPIGQLANLVGRSICAAVMARSARLGSTVPTVNGVPIRGSFVRR